jgi:hypothetical protein
MEQDQFKGVKMAMIGEYMSSFVHMLWNRFILNLGMKFMSQNI